MNKVMSRPKTKCSLIEKLALALIMAARKLQPYFQNRTIEIMTNQPFKQCIQKLKTLEMLIKWLIELREFDIQYKPQPTTKA